jgi:hypothetical protein
LLIIIVGFVALHFFICMDRQQKYLIDLCSDLDGKFFSPVSFWEQMGEQKGSFEFAGMCLQRVVTLEYFYRWPKIASLLPGIAPEERLAIRFPVVQKFWLRMIQEYNPPFDPEAVILDDPKVDSLYIIHSNQREAAKEFLSSQLPLPDLRLLNPIDRLEIHQGWGTAEVFFPARRNFQRAHLDLLTEWLARFFSEYEAQSRVVIALLHSSDARWCPYCRENLQPSSERIVECAQCNARLHENCWKENKQCTTWGCQSSLASPVTQ